MSRPATIAGGLAVPLALSAIVLAVYAQAGSFSFLNYDDALYLQDAPHVSEGLTWRGIAWAFTTFHAVNWHPATWLSHMLDVSLFGMDAGRHHLVNVLLHLLNSIVLYRLLCEATGRALESAAAAALFAVHPLQVESVAWVAERKNLLCALFFLLSLRQYCRYSAMPSARRYLSALLLFLLALLSKPMAVTLPFVMLLLDRWPLGRTGGTPGAGRLVLEKVPFLLLSAASCAMTLLAQANGAALVTLESMPLAARLENAAAAYAAYLGKAAWPSRLAFYYPMPAMSSLHATAAASAILLAALTVFAVRQARTRPWLAVGWFWFLGTLVPVIGIVQVGMQSMADRYAYLPLVGLLLALCRGAGEAASRLRIPGRAVAAAACAAIALLGVASRAQAGTWRDSGSLFRHAVAATKDNWAAHNGLGKVAFEAGDYPEALRHLQEALRLAPGIVEIRNSLGAAYARMGREDEAAAHYREALRLRPGYADARTNLGALLARRGEFDEAERLFREALASAPGSADAHVNLAHVLMRKGMDGEAIAHFRESLRLRPGDADSHLGLGLALSRTSALDEATAHLRVAVRLRPDDAEARNNLGVLLARGGAAAEAIGQFREAVRLRPGYEGARRNLERAIAGNAARAGGGT